MYLRAAIFKPELREHAPRTTFVLKGCDCQAGAAADQGESNPRPRDCESRRANHETTSKGRFASKKIARRRSESASTRTIPAQGSPRSRQIRTALQRERSDTHDLRRGFAAVKTNSYGATATTLRHARSPRRGFAAVKTDSHGATARAMRHARSPQRVHRAQDRFARDHSESDQTRTISAEGSSGSRQIRTAPQRERFDTHDLRRGFAAVKTDSHGATARAIRHARSPQRVHRAQDRFARDHSESDPTRTIPAEGSPRSRQIRTAPQRERCDAHDLRRGYAS